MGSLRWLTGAARRRGVCDAFFSEEKNQKNFKTQNFVQRANLRFAGGGFNVIFEVVPKSSAYMCAINASADLDEADRAYRRIYSSTSAKPPSKVRLASGFVGTIISTFSRSRNLNLTSFDDKLRKDWLFGRCEARGLYLLMGNSGKIKLSGECEAQESHSPHGIL